MNDKKVKGPNNIRLLKFEGNHYTTNDKIAETFNYAFLNIIFVIESII